MDTTYADAILTLDDEVSAAAARASSVLSDLEIADELRRIAAEMTRG